MATRWSWSKWLFPNRYCDVVSIWLFSENFNNLQQSDAKIEWKLQKHIHSFTLSPFLFMPPFSKCIIYCQTPNFCYSNCKFVVGIIIVSPTTTSTTSTPYSPDVQFLHWPTETIQLLGPHKIYWAEILGVSSTIPNLIFEPVFVNS